jgi:hypothetical protein
VRSTSRRSATGDPESYGEDLERQYDATWERGSALESRCRIVFVSDTPRLLCHRLLDLLTVRYFDLTEANGASDAV